MDNRRVDDLSQIINRINAHRDSLKNRFFLTEAQHQKIAVLDVAFNYLTDEKTTRKDFEVILEKNPRYGETSDVSETQRIIDAVLAIQMRISMPKYDELKEKLNKVEPGESEGLCVACSLETAKILIDGDHYEPKDVNTDVKANRKLSEIQIRDLSKQLSGKQSNQGERLSNTITGEEFIKYFKAKTPNSVFILTNEDHTFNILLSNSNQIYLLDSDKHIYKEVNKSDDLKVDLALITGNSDHEGQKFDYSSSYEDVQSVFYIGQAHSDWSEKKSPDFSIEKASEFKQKFRE